VTGLGEIGEPAAREMSQPGPPKWELRPDRPHPARVYDYWLGGKDNFAADRDAAQWALREIPQWRDYALGNRQFLARVVRFLCDAGIRRFLDIGSGPPASPNVHEVARAWAPGVRVVYVDHDPMAFLHTEALVASDPMTSVVRGDLRDPDTVLRGAAELLDPGQPAALLIVATLHHVADEDDPAAAVARYLPAFAPGSYLVISHCTGEFAPEKVHATTAEARSRGAVFRPRGKDAIRAMFDGRELLEPGLVLVLRCRPEGGKPGPNADRAWAYAGVAPI
jgi:SAM-dependent methyltransferase